MGVNLDIPGAVHKAIIFDTALAIAELEKYGHTTIITPAVLRNVKKESKWELRETDLSTPNYGWEVILEVVGLADDPTS